MIKIINKNFVFLSPSFYIRNKNLSIFIVCLLCFFIEYAVSTSILKNKLNGVINQRIKICKQLDSQNKQLVLYLKHKKVIHEFQQTYSILKKQLSDVDKTGLIVRKLINISSLSSVSINSLKSMPVVRKESIAILPFEIVMHGNYRQLLSFIDAFESLPYLGILQKIKITRMDTDGNILNMKALIEIYSINI